MTICGPLCGDGMEGPHFRLFSPSGAAMAGLPCACARPHTFHWCPLRQTQRWFLSCQVEGWNPPRPQVGQRKGRLAPSRNSSRWSGSPANGLGSHGGGVYRPRRAGRAFLLSIGRFSMRPLCKSVPLPRKPGFFRPEGHLALLGGIRTRRVWGGPLGGCFRDRQPPRLSFWNREDLLGITPVLSV